MVDAFLGWCAQDERTAATAAAEPGHAQPPTSCDGCWSERRRFHRRSLPEPGRVKTKPDVASQREPSGCSAEAGRSLGQPESSWPTPRSFRYCRSSSQRQRACPRLPQASGAERRPPESQLAKD